MNACTSINKTRFATMMAVAVVAGWFACQASAETAEILLVTKTNFNWGPYESATEPVSDTTVFAAGETFYVEVWAQTSHSSGLTAVSLDITYAPLEASVITSGGSGWMTGGLYRPPLYFASLPNGTVDNVNGLVDDLSGVYLPAGGCAAAPVGNAPNWVLVVILEMRAEADGAPVILGSDTGNPAFGTAPCGESDLDPADIHYTGINESSGATDDLILNVPGAPQVVPVGQQVNIDLQVANLSTAINGVQALMHYETSELTLVSITPAASWTEAAEIDTSGDIAYAVSYPGGSVGGGAGPWTVATLTFSADVAGTPVVTFLGDNPPAYPSLINKLTDAATAEPIIPTTFDTEAGDIVVVDSQCLIGGEYYIAGQPNPLNECEVCDPSESVTEWTPLGSGTACGNLTPGDCENQDTCDGAGTCVDNGFKDSSTECRADTGDCDVAEYCTGSDADCPADVFEPEGTFCGGMPGACEEQDTCDGAGTCDDNGFKDSSTECRADTGDCDVAEYCTGSDADCPADVFEPEGTFCGGMPGACEEQDTCDGAGTCDDNGFKDSSTECRASAGDCDIAETCSGDSADCPADAFEPDTTECRGAAGDCDVAEFCTGSDAACPADAKSTDECRASAGDCDVAEVCDGVSNDCPADAFEPDTTECRGAAGDCDVAEFCTGSDAACPADAKSTDECRASAGDCDIAEVCDGVSNDCPADAFEPDTTECRGAAGDCDVAEFCTGSDAACPADAKSTDECRASAGDCDVAEVCDGVSNDCPADAFEPDTTECRGAAGDCDVAEFCTGSDAACPADAKSTDECRAAAGDCDIAEVCDGVSNDCPADAFEPDTTECRGAAGDCDVAEFCTGSDAACPADAKSTDECRASAGDCDVAEVCDGVSNDCPADAFEPDTTECRGAAGDCDVAEFCTGSDAACPADAKSTDECRASAGDCDVAEVCDGVSNDCPADAFEPDTTECRGAAGDCDVAEYCTGSDADCPADGFEPDGTPCDDDLFCTDTDTCQEGVCVGSGDTCDDSDPCTIDTCDEGNDLCSNDDTTHIDVTIEIDALGNAVTRDVTFILTDCGANAETIVQPVDFDSSGVGSLTLTADMLTAVDIGEIDYLQATEGHTLARLLNVGFAGPDFCYATTLFTDADKLLAGDFSNDYVDQDSLVDITDFAILAIEWNQWVDPEQGTLADATGDGWQDIADFTAIQANFADVGDAEDACPSFLGIGSAGSPQIQIPVTDLLVANAELADLNSDGMIDVQDIYLFAEENKLVLTRGFKAKLRRLEGAAALHRQAIPARP